MRRAGGVAACRYVGAAVCRRQMGVPRRHRGHRRAIGRMRAGKFHCMYESTMENVRGFVDLKSKYDHGIYRILNENLKFPDWSLAV
eukprot:COSAG03_NODE_515_length_7268_cov_2.448598_2_plen_86_part_00